MRHLHWLTVMLMVLAYVSINIRGQFERGSDPRLFVMQSHFLIGLAILALTLPRLLARLRCPVPPITPAPTPLSLRLSQLTHVLLYAFLLVQPLLGVATVFLEGRGLNIPLTDIGIPSPLAKNEALAGRLEDLHGGLGELFYWVIGLHVAAAVAWHHLLRRDDTLRRML